MSINFIGRIGELKKYRIGCDLCHKEFDQEVYAFLDLVNIIKTSGWKISKDDAGEWTHYCSKCREVGIE